MRHVLMMAVVAELLVAGAFGRDLLVDVVRQPHSVVDKGDVIATVHSTQRSPVKEILVTANNQILVELKPDEATRPNFFDLNERTVIFTPDGTGRYSREVRELEWEEDIGEEVEYRHGSGAVIMLENFDFPFAGQRWDSFHLGPPSVLTFGRPFTFQLQRLIITMQEIANKFISAPTISTFYHPDLFGTLHVARWTDRIVVTWLSWRTSHNVHGVPPEKFARIQTVLGADGSIRFNYLDVPYGDGIVGVFEGEGPTPGVDLSQSDSRVVSRHHEVFHYRSLPDTAAIACHLIGMLDEVFDLFVFHSEFRMDTQYPSTPWNKWAFKEQGSGSTIDRYVPCGEGRLKGHWHIPIWIQSDSVFNASPFLPKDHEGFDAGLYLFAHEFAHSWLAYFEYDHAGQREPLYDTGFCQCHWAWNLHAPAAFRWHAEKTTLSSIMGGDYWIDYGNGTFKSAGLGDGFSWLDLYAMGLADADEVPDMFILNNVKRVNDPNLGFVYTGEKEIVSIDQIVAAEGPRVPGPAHSQKVFNAGFVYLLEPGQTPSGDLLDLHLTYKYRVFEYWSHITGRRSQITTVVPRIANNQPPRAVGTIRAQTLTEEEMPVEVDVRGYFSDPDGDPLTYRVASSDVDVAEVEIGASIVKIEPVSAGDATVTVTAKDGRGGLAHQTITVLVDAKLDENPPDFTFVPVILNAEGKNNASFSSELTLTNRGAKHATLDFAYTAHAGGGSGAVREYLEPGRQWIVPDAVEFLREWGLPIPDTGNRIGTLRGGVLQARLIRHRYHGSNNHISP